jgi:hypothetical protein
MAPLSAIAVGKIGCEAIVTLGLTLTHPRNGYNVMDASRKAQSPHSYGPIE